MPIYNLFESSEEESQRDEVPKKDRLIPSLTARLLFLVLLFVAIGWACWGIVVLGFVSPFYLLSGGRIGGRTFQVRWKGLKRAAVCFLALLIALFSPSLGIMIGCTYFLMHDKRGIEEVIPSSLRDQFQEFL